MASVSPPPFSCASSSPFFGAATLLSRRDLRHCLDERLSLRSRGDGDRDRRGVNATTTTSKQHTIAAIPPPSFPACLAGFLCPGNPKKRRTRHCRSEAAQAIVSPTKCVWAQEHKSMLRPGTRSGRSIDWLTTTNLGTSTKVDEKVGKRGAGGGGGGGGGRATKSRWELGRGKEKVGEVFAKRRIGERRWTGEQQTSAREREGVLRLQPKPGGVRRGEREGEMERRGGGEARDATRRVRM